MEICKVCSGISIYFDESVVLNYNAKYLMCKNCGSIQIHEPHWIEEAHGDAIANLDVGLVSRTLVAGRLILTFLRFQRSKNIEGVDWGGGTGLLTRMLRDCGLNVFSYDKYATQYLAHGFIINQNSLSKPMTFISAIECFEHLVNPLIDLGEAAKNKSYMILTTETTPNPSVKPSSKNWWYYMPETGQHITFASSKGIKIFGELLEFPNYLRVGDMHFFSKNKITLMNKVVMRSSVLRTIFLILVPEYFRRRYSLIDQDKQKILGI